MDDGAGGGSELVAGQGGGARAGGRGSRGPGTEAVGRGGVARGGGQGTGGEVPIQLLGQESHAREQEPKLKLALQLR